MFKINEIVIYRKEVFKITEIKKKSQTREEYYVLEPYYVKEGLRTRLEVPVSNRMDYLRKLSTPEEIETLIQRIPDIPEIEGNTRIIESDYRAKLKNATLEDLVSIIKTTYGRNQERERQNKHSGSTDDNYFRQAELLLYREVGAALDMSEEEARDYITQRLSSK